MSSIKCFDLSPQVHTGQALSGSNFFPLTGKASYILLPVSQYNNEMSRSHSRQIDLRRLALV